MMYFKPGIPCFVLLALVVGFSWTQVSAQPMAPAGASGDVADPQLAASFLDLLDAGRYDEALQMTTAAVQQALAHGKLRQVWEGLPVQFGARRSRAAPRSERVEGQPVVAIALDYGGTLLDARIVFDTQQRIQGFRLVPAAVPARAAAAPPVDERILERELAVGEGGRALPGTLTLPRGRGPFAAAVLVHGSGPHDRDQRIGPTAIFRDLAHGLAVRGIAVLRFDKRTLAYPQEFADGDFTIDDETTDDAVAAIESLRAQPEVDGRRVFVIGHSQGAMMAPRIAQRSPGIAGLVLLAAPARPLHLVYLAQLDYLAGLDGEVGAAEQARIDAERAKVEALATMRPDAPAAGNLLGLPAKYWIDLRDYDPVALARDLPQPLLVLQGGRDYQVTAAEDFAGWQAAFAPEGRAQLRVYPALNHLFIAGEGASTPAEYGREGRVAEDVMADIAAWIEARR